MSNKVFIEYLEADAQTGKDRIVQGYFELIDQKDDYIKIRSGKNIITLPNHRWLKIKEANSNSTSVRRIT